MYGCDNGAYVCVCVRSDCDDNDDGCDAMCMCVCAMVSGCMCDDAMYDCAMTPRRCDA